VDQGHAAPIVAISRHGRLPRSHEPAETVPVALAPSVTAADAGSVLDLLRAVRAAARGVDARVAVDALRPATAALWGALLEAERRRFLRHLRPLWDVLRHRLAPQAGSALGDLVASGRLTVRAARLTHLAEVAGGVRVRLQPRGTGPVETLTVGRVVNATGPEPDPVRSADPLLTALRVRGHVRRDPLGLGIVTAPDGAVVGQGGSPSEWLFTIGPLRRGELWESVAIPELRDQAERLAARLLSNRIVTGL
ncbi:MAG: hypothetical protein MUC67_03495, partial [Acidobacteria bacterium]|nr:hypothetical protein [Acidobacteriota bacterium]